MPDTIAIDYNFPVTRDHVPFAKYNYKFQECKQLLSQTKINLTTYSKLMNDVTQFSYLKFKLDGQPVKLFPYQDMILNDPHKFKIFRAARQIGKSICLDIKAARNVIIDHGYGHNECIISASLAQAGYQMRRVKQLLNSISGIEWRASTDNNSLLIVDILDDEGKVKYQNMLVVTPCTEGSLGYSFHEVNLDEVEYWVDIDIENFMNNIIGPTILATNGSITTFSNPNGSENYIAFLENLRLPNGEKKYHTYVFNFFDCPLNDQAKFELNTAGLNRQQIESQYLAVRTLSDKYYFTVDEVEKSYDAKLDREKDWIADGKETFWFLDVGAKKDQSALCGAYITTEESGLTNRPFTHVYIFKMHVYPVGYPISRVVGSHSTENESDGWHYEKSVREYLEEYSLVKEVYPIFGCDVTGNSGIVPLFQSCGISPEDVTFSGPKKWAMYQRIKYYLEKKLLHRIKSKEFEYQMKRIVVTKLRTSTYNRVGHEFDNDKDDVPDAVAGVIQMCDNYSIVTPGATLLEYDYDETEEKEDMSDYDDSLIL